MAFVWSHETKSVIPKYKDEEWHFINSKHNKKQLDKWGIWCLKKQNVNAGKQIAHEFEKQILIP